MECPERPTNDFNIDLIQIHIARIKALVDDIYGLLDAYFFLVSWDNRTLTSFSLLIFVSTCLTLKAEYMGRSVPYIYTCFVYQSINLAMSQTILIFFTLQCTGICCFDNDDVSPSNSSER